MLGMGLLVGAMDIATANNTVAIVMANPIASADGPNLRHLAGARRLRCSIPSRACFRESFLTELRCW